MRVQLFALVLLVQTVLQAPEAQAQQWGTGQYGAGQACGYAKGQAAAAAPVEDDEISELKSEQSDLKEDKRDLAKRLRELEAKKTKYEEAISDSLTPDWSQAVTSHIEGNASCGCGVTALPQTPSPQAPPNSERPILPPNPQNNPPPREPRSSPALSRNSRTSDRAPASATGSESACRAC